MRGIKSGMNVIISEDKKLITWTCPKCRCLNIHKWYGREKHICSNCEEWTDIKGESAPVIRS